MLIAAVTFIFSYVHKARECDWMCFRNHPAAKPCHGSKDIAGQRKVSNRSEHSYHTKKGVCWIFFSILLSYFCTILVNGLRIIAAIYLPLTFDRLNLWNAWLTPQKLHTAIGVVVYFSALLSLHQLVGRLFQEPSSARQVLQRRFYAAPVPRQIPNESFSASQQETASKVRTSSPGSVKSPAPQSGGRLGCLAPVFWYFFIVLGIPALNNALGKNSEVFSEFALLITLCCGSVLVIFCLVKKCAAMRK